MGKHRFKGGGWSSTSLGRPGWENTCQERTRRATPINIAQDWKHESSGQDGAAQVKGGPGWDNTDKAKQKKYVCFRLPTVPKFRSPTPSFFIVVFVFFTIDSSRRKMSSVSSLFLLQLILKLTLLKVFF